MTTTLELEGIEGVQVRRDVPLMSFTSIGTGGRALYVVEVERKEALAEVVRRVRVSGISDAKTFILGGGTNLLVSDDGFDGVVIRLLGEFNLVEVLGTRITAGAAVTLMKLISAAEGAGIGGLEFLSGIPGTLGGAIAMNAGAWGMGIWDKIVQVNGVDKKGTVVTKRTDSHSVGYRRGNLPGGFIVSEALLECEEADREQIAQKVKEVIGKRRLIGSDELRTFGSVFKNPGGEFAGKLLEEAGVLGLERGGAAVSKDHANFIINKGNATSGDILELINTMKRQVKDRFDVDLIPEVVLLGFEESEIEGQKTREE